MALIQVLAVLHASFVPGPRQAAALIGNIPFLRQWNGPEALFETRCLLMHLLKTETFTSTGHSEHGWEVYFAYRSTGS